MYSHHYAMALHRERQQELADASEGRRRTSATRPKPRRKLR
jgi:hypothetical protein